MRRGRTCELRSRVSLILGTCERLGRHDVAEWLDGERFAVRYHLRSRGGESQICAHSARIMNAIWPRLRELTRAGRRRSTCPGRFETCVNCRAPGESARDMADLLGPIGPAKTLYSAMSIRHVGGRRHVSSTITLLTEIGPTTSWVLLLTLRSISVMSRPGVPRRSHLAIG